MKWTGWVFWLVLWPLLTKADEGQRCLQCHGNQPATPPVATTRIAPLLPEQFSMQWEMFEFASEKRPPFAKIPTPHQVLRGTTHYDWKRRGMTEIYHDKCIDIFPNGRDYPCQFISLHEKTYLVRSPKNVPATCCLWSKGPFYAPRPDVIRNMSFDRTIRFRGKKVDTWLLDIPLPGPFGYGFLRNSDTPAMFWFPVISGWVQQNFRDFEKKEPDAKVFDLPKPCLVENLPTCE